MTQLKPIAASLLLLAIFSTPKVEATVTQKDAVSPRLNPSNTIAQSTTNIPFEVCSESKTWVRPTETQQRKQLQSMKRYPDETIAQLGGSYWTHNILSFTKYPGGSGTYDITHRTGLWTLHDATHPSKCDGFSVIDSGQKASVWLLLHRVKSTKWQGNRYVMVVQPTSSGVQVIRFPRRERQEKLPLTVVTEDGKRVNVLAD